MQNRGRILVVDDTPATLYATGRILKSAGFDIVGATTGAEALRLADDSIDLVVLDVQLPDIHGFEVCRQLRARDTTTLLPIVHLSATFRTDLDRAQGLDAGADGYLTHPVEPIVLVATINTLLRARRAEEQQRSSEEQFREVFQDAPIGICLLDTTGAFMEANPVMCRLLGKAREEIVGLCLQEFAAGQHRETVEDALGAVRARGEWHGYFSLVRADGSPADVDWHIKAPARASTWLALADDITQQRRYEAEREQLLAKESAARDEAERLNRLKDQFIAVLGHELRNPLAAIATGVDLLKSGAVGGEKVSWVHNSIARQTAQLTLLINDLIDTTRISHGKFALNKKTVRLDAVVASAVESSSELIDKYEHKITVSTNPPDVLLEADPLRLEQIIVNLLTNAVRYTPNGGQIRLETKCQDGFLELLVSDTGVGLSEQDIQKIFEPFAQIGAPGQGLGIGLTLVRQLVELHGGSISVTSDGPSKGSAFRIMLPVGSIGSPEEPPAAEHAPIRTPVRILIVDDNEAVALMMQMLLEESNYSIEGAFTGASALEIAPQFKPDLVLLDLGLPDISGYEVAERLREAGLQDATIAAVSGFSSEQAKSRLRQANFDAHLIKPASAGQIHALVESILVQRQADVKTARKSP
jgi:PAS domain S-box-containing protein